MQEKFSITEVSTLRRDLRQASLDSFQGAEIIKSFVTKRGYGISSEQAWDVALQLEHTGDNLEFFHRQLEALALVM